MFMSDQISLGYVVRAFGIKGGVVIKLLNDDSLTLAEGLKITVCQKKLPPKSLTISIIMDRGRVFFEEITSREEAESLRGCEILVARELLPPLEDDEYYFSDLIGASIVDMDGKVIGHLVDFSSNNAQTLFEIKTTEGKLASIPSVKPIIQKIDPDNKIIIVDLPLGILDLEA